MSESKNLTVSAVNKYIQYILKNDKYLKSIEVTGEVSNYKPHHTKHMYFSLKDDDARIDCVMFSSSAKNVDFSMKNGDKVIISGYVDVYPATGKYQLYANKIKLDGIGELSVKFEMIKQKLMKEGLFDLLKRDIPRFPQKIGVITATSGAAIKDILKTIESRYTLAEVTVFRTIVQGENGASSIINSLKLANNYDLDVLIIGRGGGSIEDLWNFNEESVIREIVKCKCPIISGVGHETDFTLSDFTCDRRAATPTAAAVIATPNARDEIMKFDNLDVVLRSKVKSIYEKQQLILEKYSIGYLFKLLNNVFINGQMVHANETKRLEDLIVKKISSSYYQLNLLNSSNLGKLLDRKLYKNQVKLEHYFNKLKTNISRYYDKSEREFEKYVTILEQVSPLKILSRGYSVSYSNNKVVKSVDDVGEDLKLLLVDGQVKMRVEIKEVLKNG
ncbi:MAG: exodeoxyribonuclease VII large subunit [Bacilli bacterium]